MQKRSAEEITMNLDKKWGIATATVLVLGAFATGCSAEVEEETDEVADNVDESSQEVNAASCAASRAAGAVPTLHAKLLDAIAYAEGTEGRGNDGYDIMFTHRRFSSCTSHPNQTICAGRLCSTAAGRYQFLYTTWKGLGYSTFNPGNQERGAMKLVSRRGGSVPTSRPMSATEFANLMNRVSYEWASLPPGRYGQPSKSMSQMYSAYCQRAGC
jgi:muramidase (phage lysozyme)